LTPEALTEICNHYVIHSAITFDLHPYGVCIPAEGLLAAGGDRNVAQLMVRNVDDAVVRELKKRAARRNHSAEQEHREILGQALLRPRRRSLAEVLAAMPDAGKDADFERLQIDRRA
jgi:plasmid stability protein